MTKVQYQTSRGAKAKSGRSLRSKKQITLQERRAEAADLIWQYTEERRKQLTAELPFAIQDPEHGWGVIVKPVKPRKPWVGGRAVVLFRWIQGRH